MTEKSYRIRTKVGEEPSVINVKLQQTFDTLEILSLKLTQEDTYKLYKSGYGVIVGRVLANGGVGIPNAKISVFIESEADDNTIESILYPFSSVTDKNKDNVRYNLLPDSVDDNCYQNVGTFPNKRLMLDNDDVLEVFDKYYKYTTCTNQSGDYMLCNIPVGSQLLHVDIDLSDVGFLSQRPRDMVYKGSPITLFESPNKFKQDTNLDSLAQIKSQNIGVYVFPFWGDTTEDDNIAITRCDIQIDYKFEPTCVFMGATIGDNDGHINKNCEPSKLTGKMSNLITSQGKIEMIRKTPDGLVEEFAINGNKLIDEDGVFCYQIPMNLDYVTTDEFGNLVPTDDPNKGIPTRTSVRFRFTLDDEIGNVSKSKRCSYLVPNNPRINGDYVDFTETKKVDYEFGSLTKDENYRDLFWNKVYTVKSFIPRLQNDDNHKTRLFSGIKWINHGGDKNLFPYNGLTMKLGFQYTMICFITKFIIYLVTLLNNVISTFGAIVCYLAEALEKLNNEKILDLFVNDKLLKKIKNAIPRCIKLGTEFCDDGQNKIIYYPGCSGSDCVWEYMNELFTQSDEYLNGYQISNLPKHILDYKNEQNISLMNCVENSLVQENEVTSYNFYNDWINGTLFFPKWHRYIRPKKYFLFGLFKLKRKDEWCSADKKAETYYVQHCAISQDPQPSECGDDCESSIEMLDIKKGVVVSKETMLGQTVYYYKAADYVNELNDVLLLFATDIVLLGSLNENDVDGTPQFFKNLPPTTYQLPTEVLDVDQHIESIHYKEDGSVEIITDSNVEASGQDWGNKNTELCKNGKNGDSGLFYGVTCARIDMKVKSCINLRRICELGVSLDETQELPISALTASEDESNFRRLISDGFVSWDELYDNDSRAMFATMNHNNLKTEYNNQTGYKQYNFTYLYPVNFDGALRKSMEAVQRQCDGITYKNNYKLEEESKDYTTFRLGEKPFYYDNGKMPRYENSFYFYFGLTPGATAIEKFNTQYFSPCENIQPIAKTPIYSFVGNKWCYDKIDVDEDGKLTENEKNRRDGYIKLDLGKLTAPYTIKFTNADRSDLPDLVITDVDFEKVYIGNTTDYLLNNGLISTTDGITRQNNLNGYECLSNYTINIVSDSNDVTNDYIYDECTLSNGNWLLTITDDEDKEEELYIPFFTEKIKANIIVDSFRVSTNDLYNTNIIPITPNKTDYPPFALNEWHTVADISTLKYNSNTNRKEREIGGLIIIKDIFQENEKLTADNVYVVVKSVKNILNDKYKLYDEDNNVLEIKKEQDYYYVIDDKKVPCDDKGFVYKQNDNGEKYQLFDEDNKVLEIIQIVRDYYYVHSNEKCDKDGYLYDVKLDTENGKKQFIVDSNDIIQRDYGFNKDNDDKSSMYFGVPVGNQDYEVTITYRCNSDYNGDDENDFTNNTLTMIVNVAEMTPTKFYINNIDYDIIKKFKSGWDVYDTRKTTLELSKRADIKKIKGWTNITKIAVPSIFTKDNLPSWGELDNLVFYLTKSVEGEDYCPYEWTEEYIFDKSNYNAVRRLIEEYNILASPKDVYNFNLTEFTDVNSMSTSDEGFIYVNGIGEVYKKPETDDIVDFVNMGDVSFYKKREVRETKNEKESYYIYNSYDNMYCYVLIPVINITDDQNQTKYQTIYNKKRLNFYIYKNGNENENTYYPISPKFDKSTHRITGYEYILNTTRIECDYNGYIMNGQVITFNNNNMEVVVDVDDGLYLKIKNLVLLTEYENDYIYVCDADNYPYKLPNFYKYGDFYYVRDEKNYKRIPCDKWGNILAWDNNNDLYTFSDDYSEEKTSQKTNTYYNYVDLLANSDGFLFSQKIYQEYWKPTNEGGWELDEIVGVNTISDVVNRACEILEISSDKIIPSIYGGYIVDSLNGIQFVSIIYDNVTNKNIVFSYATENNGKTRFFKKTPKNNILTKNEEGNIEELVYIYNPSIKNTINPSLNLKDGEGYLCDKDGYLYKRSADGKCIATTDKLITNKNINVLTNYNNNWYYTYHKDFIFSVYENNVKYYLETDENGMVLKVDNSNFNNHVKCDINGYVYMLDRNGSIKELNDNDKSKISNDLYNGFHYVKTDNNKIIYCDERGKIYNTLNGQVLRFIDADGNVLNHTSEEYTSRSYQIIEFEYNGVKYSGIVKKNFFGDDCREDVNITNGNNKLIINEIPTPCDKDGYVYVTDYNNNKLQYYSDTDDYVIENDNDDIKIKTKKNIKGETVYIDNIDNNTYVYVKNSGKPFTLEEVGDFISRKENVYLINKQLFIPCDKNGYVYFKDTENIQLDYKEKEGKKFISIPCDDEGYVYDVKNCYKYKLPYEIHENENNSHTCNNKPCDKDGNFYEVDENGNKVKSDSINTTLKLYSYWANGNDETQYYYSIGGPIKVFMKFDDSNNSLVKQKDENGKPYTINGYDSQLNYGIKGGDNYGNFYLIVRQEDIEDNKIDLKNVNDETVLTYGYKVYCNDEGVIIHNNNGIKNFNTKNNPDVSVIQKMFYDYRYVKEENKDKYYYVFENYYVFYYNSEKQFSNAFFDEELKIECDAWGRIIEKNEKIQKNGYVLKYNKKVDSDPYFYFYYKIPIYNNTCLYCNFKGYILEEDNDGNHYDLYTNNNDSCECKRMFLCSEMDDETNDEANFYYDLNPYKVFCQTVGVYKDFVSNKNICNEKYQIKNYYNTTEKRKYATNDDGQTYYYYEIDGCIIYCDKDGYVSERDGKTDQEDKNITLYKLTIKSVSNIESKTVLMIGNNIIPYDSNDKLNENLKKTINYNTYTIDGKLCDEWGYLYKTSEKGDKVKGENVISSHNNVYYYLNDNNMKIYCDKDGYVYSMSYKNEKYKLNYEIDSVSKNYIKQIEEDEKGYVYLVDNTNEKTTLMKDYNMSLNNVHLENISTSDSSPKIKKHTYYQITDLDSFDETSILLKNFELLETDEYGNFLFSSLGYDLDKNKNKYKLFNQDCSIVDIENISIRKDSFDYLHYLITNDNIDVYCDEKGYVIDKTPEKLNIIETVYVNNKPYYYYPIGGKIMIYCDKDGYVLSETEGEKYKLNYEIFDGEYSLYNPDNWYYYDFGNENKVYCNNEGITLNVNPNDERYKLNSKVITDTDQGNYYEIDGIQIYCDSNGYVVSGERYNKVILSMDKYTIKYVYYDFGGVIVYCDEEGYVLDKTPEGENYTLNSLRIGMYYDVAINKIYCDEKGYVIDKTPEGENYKLQGYKIEGVKNYYKYNNMTICDKGGLIIEDVEIDENENILVYNNQQNCYYYNNTELYPCDKDGYIYDTDENGVIQKKNNNYAIESYNIYYDNISIQNDDQCNSYDYNTKGERYKYDEKYKCISNNTFYYKIPCDEYGYVFDVYKFINDKVYVKYYLYNGEPNKESYNQINSTAYGYYYSNGTPCNNNGFVYALNDNKNKYKLNIHNFKKVDVETYYEIPCDKDGYVYKTNKDNELQQLTSTINIPCDNDGYVFLLGIDKVDVNAIKYDIEIESYYYENGNVKVLCDIEGNTYKLYKGERHKLDEKTPKHSSYDVTNEYLYKENDNSLTPYNKCETNNYNLCKLFNKLSYSN